MKNRMQGEFDKWRLAFSGSKTPDQFRQSLCDLFGRARFDYGQGFACKTLATIGYIGCSIDCIGEDMISSDRATAVVQKNVH